MNCSQISLLGQTPSNEANLGELIRAKRCHGFLGRCSFLECSPVVEALCELFLSFWKSWNFDLLLIEFGVLNRISTRDVWKPEKSICARNPFNLNREKNKSVLLEACGLWLGGSFREGGRPKDLSEIRFLTFDLERSNSPNTS
jgi:hypothetical protein